MKYKYYLFDLDGVIVNTDEIQYKTTVNIISEILNYEVSNDTVLDKVFRSTITTLEKLNILSSYLNLDKNMIDDIYNKKKERSDYYFSKLQLDNEKIEMMKYLKKNNCCISIVTNSNKKSCELILKTIGVYDFVDIIITNEDILNKKPSSEPYLKAIEKLGASKEECIIFEDSEVGLISAKASGCDYYHVKSCLDVNTILIQKLNDN
jgi:HAD superfamily hydrolase (TIGR01509 family)